jgi:hypothetical protein
MGFLIDAVAHGLLACWYSGAIWVADGLVIGCVTTDVIWLRLSPAPRTMQVLCRPDIDGVGFQA